MDAAFYRPPRHQNVLDELPLFAAPAPSVAVPTSEAAADAVDSPDGRQRAAAIRSRLLVLLCSREAGFTADELEVETGVPGNTVRPRLAELHTAGLIEASATITRATRTGKQARVVFPTTAGRKAVERAA
jgi:hypothetical protein